jgi:beta-lactam-binding protein with PASTA domain
VRDGRSGKNQESVAISVAGNPPLPIETPVLGSLFKVGQQITAVEKRVKSKRRCVVPKLRGLSVRRAKRKLKRAGCRYRVRGEGRVVSTSPRRGARTRKTVLVRAARKRR